MYDCIISSLTLDTYEIQEVIIPVDTSTGYFSINCTFLTGSQAKGCAIEVFNDNLLEIVRRPLTVILGCKEDFLTSGE